jgi:biotin carboxyl carrier protein
MKFSIKIGEKEYLIEIFEIEEGVKILVNGKEFYFPLEEQKIFYPKISTDKRDFQEKKILAPISGIISEVFVKEGDFVKKGEKLFSLSAMKMENEILSDFDGKIKKILVKKGDKVKKDDLLLIGV